jgi:hypothetical protein
VGGRPLSHHALLRRPYTIVQAVDTRDGSEEIAYALLISVVAGTGIRRPFGRCLGAGFWSIRSGAHDQPHVRRQRVGRVYSCRDVCGGSLQNRAVLSTHGLAERVNGGDANVTESSPEQLLIVPGPSDGDVQPRTGARKAGAPRWLPFSKQFSPEQIQSLGDFLDILEKGAGSEEEIKLAILERFRPEASPSNRQLQTMAYNAILSARHYGIVDRKFQLTEFGRHLRNAADDQARITLLARHILQHLNGIELVRGLDGITRAGLKFRKEQIAEQFSTKGLWSNSDGTDINHIVAWLRAAGIFKGDAGFSLDTARFAELAEITMDEVSQVGRVDSVGAAILEELALMPGHTATSGEIQRRLRARSGLEFNVPRFVAIHLQPLLKADLIAVEKATGGRGGEAMRITATPLFKNTVVQALLKRVRETGLTVTDPELQIPMAELVERMKSSDRDVKGRALELFALRLLLRLGLSEIRWRSRPRQAEEIDGSAVGYTPVHAKWQVQCKNTDTLHVDDAAKEVGLALRNRSTIVMLVTTGHFRVY